MRAHIVIRYVGFILLLNAAFMLVSAMISLFNGMDTDFFPLMFSFFMTAILGAFPLIFVPSYPHVTTKEGYMIVVSSWILSCLVGMMPYVLWGGEFTVMNSWFESASGFTTTGSTILNNIEAVPHGLLFWRSSTHWIGGIGVVLFALVILPAMGGKTKMTLSSVEMSTLAKDNFRYNTKKILKIIGVVYVGLTLLLAILLRIAGMTWFDAVNHSFSTIATGGFSTKNLSIMYFDSIYIEVILMVFMTAAALHMGLVYATMTGRSNNLFKSEVARYYILSLLISGGAIALYLYATNYYGSLWLSLRYALFQIISLSSTTGFANCDTAFWAPFAVLILVFFTAQGASAGSTGGGIKADRMILFVKSIKARIVQQQHPNAVVRIKLNKVTQDLSVVNTAVLLIAFYLMLVLASSLVLTLMGMDLISSTTAVIASMSNVGPGFGEVSCLSNYDGLPSAAKFLLSWLMLIGRLEIFGFIHLFFIASWK